MLILGIIMIILANVLEMKPQGYRVLMTLGTVLAVVGTILLIMNATGNFPHRLY
jgi:hypothetical protein